MVTLAAATSGSRTLPTARGRSAGEASLLRYRSGIPKSANTRVQTQGEHGPPAPPPIRTTCLASGVFPFTDLLRKCTNESVHSWHGRVLRASPPRASPPQRSSGEVADHHVADHLAVALVAGWVDEVAPERGQERVLVGHPEEAECADHHVQVDRVAPPPERAGGVTALEYPLGRGDHRAVQPAEDLGLADVLGPVNVLDRDQPDEIRMRLVMVEGELSELSDRRDRVEVIDVELRLDIAEQRIDPLQGRDEELLLAAEVVVDHPLRGARLGGDLVDPRSGKPVADELPDRDIEDFLAGEIGIPPPRGHLGGVRPGNHRIPFARGPRRAWPSPFHSASQKP